MDKDVDKEVDKDGDVELGSNNSMLSTKGTELVTGDEHFVIVFSHVILQLMLVITFIFQL